MYVGFFFFQRAPAVRRVHARVPPLRRGPRLSRRASALPLGLWQTNTSCTHARTNADKTPDEVRREFNIKEPFSPEVERTLREENKWSTEPPIGS